MNEVMSFDVEKAIVEAQSPSIDELTREALTFVPNEKNRKIVFKDGGAAMEYEIFKIVDEYSPILKKKAINWDFENPPGNLQYIVISMIQTMIKSGGVGLAANQCGLRYNMFVMGTGQYVEAIINPEIISSSGEEFDNEGCLSFPGLFMKVKRATRVTVRYYDMQGVQKEQTFDGLTARIFQHEFDHLNGIKFVERVSKTTLMQARNKVKTNLRKLKKYKEDMRKREAQIKAQRKTLQGNNGGGLVITQSSNESSLQPVINDKLVLEIPELSITT